MANKTLPTLVAGSAVIAGDLFISRQGSDTDDKKVTGTQLATFISANLVNSVVTSASANALAVGPNGATSPAFNIDASAATASTGWGITATAAAGTPTLAVISSGANESGVITAKGTGSLTVGPAGAGALNFRVNSVVQGSLSSNGSAWTFNPTIATAPTAHFIYTAPADTGMTAGANSTIMDMNFASIRQHASNTAVTSDIGLNILAPTFSFATAGGVINKASTVYISGPPIAGTNAAITTPYALEVNTGNTYLDGKIVQGATNTAVGTTGAQTINKASGTVNFAAAAVSLVVTNSLVTTSSIVYAVIRTADSTATIKNVVPAAGSFTITFTAAATAETSVGFVVFN